MCETHLKTASIQHDNIMALEVTRAFQNACVNRVQQNEIPHSPHQDKGLGTSTRLAIGNFHW